MGKRGPKSAAELSVKSPVRQLSAYDRMGRSHDLPPPPPHLQPPTRAWWSDIVERRDLESHQLRLLQLAGEAWDRGVMAREALAEHGLTFMDDKGMIRARPEVAIERDSRIAFARLIRDLDLAVEEPPRRNNGGVGVGWWQLER